MTEEALADSQDFNIEEAGESIAADLFNSGEPIESDEPKEIEEEVEEEVEEEDEEKIEEEVKTKAPPQSWKKEMHEHWNKLDPKVQDYFNLREQQMSEGINVAKEDAALGRDLRDVITPFNQLLESQGVDQKTAVQYLLNAHYTLSTADEQGKLDAFNQMAQSYGIKLDGSKVTPEVQSLQQELQQLRQIVSQSQQESQQEKQAKVAKTVEAFASDHEFFDEVADDIVPFINSGLTLEEAYEKAIWANPVTRQKELDRIEKEKLDKLEKDKQEKREKASKARSTNVNSRDTNKAPTEPSGKMFDDMSDIYREIQNR